MSIEKKIKLDENIDGSDVVVIDAVSPYENYTGEIEITSGYLLQRPEPEDDIVPTSDFDLSKEAFNTTVQTNSANITTLAVDKEQLAESEEQVKVWTYTGGGHHGHGGDDGKHGEGKHSDDRISMCIISAPCRVQ